MDESAQPVGAPFGAGQLLDHVITEFLLVVGRPVRRATALGPTPRALVGFRSGRTAVAQDRHRSVRGWARAGAWRSTRLGAAPRPPGDGFEVNPKNLTHDLREWPSATASTSRWRSSFSAVPLGLLRFNSRHRPPKRGHYPRRNQEQPRERAISIGTLAIWETALIPMLTRTSPGSSRSLRHGEVPPAARRIAQTLLPRCGLTRPDLTFQ